MTRRATCPNGQLYEPGTTCPKGHPRERPP